MKENKIVKRLRPANYWEIGSYESWLADMASEGLELVDIGLVFAHFKKTEPKNIKYRIEYSSKEVLPLEQRELYEEAGWDYIPLSGHMHIFCSSVEKNAPEIHTDSALQADTIQDLDKELKRNALMFSLVLLVTISMLLFSLFLDGTPTLMLVRLASPVLLIPLYLYIIYSQVRASLSIRKLRNSLANGTPLDHKANWRKARRNKIALIFLISLLSLPAIIIPMKRLSARHGYEFSKESDALPIPRLADIEKNPELVPEIDYLDSALGYGYDKANNYVYEWSLLAPVQYDSMENGMVEGMTWNDSIERYSPNLRYKIYELRFDFLASPLFNDLKKTHCENVTYLKDREIISIEDDFFDNLFLCQNEDIKQVFASKKNNVIYLRYKGHANFNDILCALKIALEKLDK